MKSSDFSRQIAETAKKKKHYQTLANNNLRELVFGCYFIVLIFIEILMYYILFRRS